ncbi:MAG: RDD family protein [Pirellulaceae bacterium]|jgi:uncharacterized RDD family membrane protein YckC|nr:RDD family protein [Pirellulaceae bacterium]MDP7014888.1 RDD family protein [Pirellulaceae bacterium]
MTEQNPYEPPDSQTPGDSRSADDESGSYESVESPPGVSTDNTVMPRHIAAIFDNIVALTLGFLAAKAIGEQLPLLQIALLVLAYLGYYFVFEGAIARTPGKLLTGLVVIQFNGDKCTFKQLLIRTGFRVLEVNPALFGGLPAAMSIIITTHHQRVGDIVAGTIVVPTRRLRKRK